MPPSPRPMPDLQDDTLNALNEHIQQEMQSAHEYLGASAYFSMEGLDGMAKWMRLQSHEETGHAMKFYDHILSRGGTIELKEIPKPPQQYDDPADAFRKALSREQKTTEHIDKLYQYALDAKDFALEIFLQWFIQEQVTEDDGLRHIIQRIELIGSDKAALVMLDKELGERGPPSAGG